MRTTFVPDRPETTSGTVRQNVAEKIDRWRKSFAADVQNHHRQQSAAEYAQRCEFIATLEHRLAGIMLQARLETEQLLISGELPKRRPMSGVNGLRTPQSGKGDSDSVDSDSSAT